jgi:hypothetical protein
MLHFCSLFGSYIQPKITPFLKENSLKLLVGRKNTTATYCPGGRAQWSLHPPQEQQTRVRIPPRYKVFREIEVVLLCIIDLIHVCIVFVFT